MEEKKGSDANSEDSSPMSKAVEQEEEKLLEDRVKKEDAEHELKPGEEVHLDDTQFTKLDELLTQTQMYSEFLLEKMEDITVV